MFQDDEWAVEVDSRRRRSSSSPPRSRYLSSIADQPVVEQASSTKEVKPNINLLSPRHTDGMRRGSAPLGEEVAASLAGAQEVVVSGAGKDSDVVEGKAGEEKTSVGGGEGEGTEGTRTKSSSEVTGMGEEERGASEKRGVVGGEGEGSQAARPKSATQVRGDKEGLGPEEQGSVEVRDGPRGKSSSEVVMVGERQASLDLSIQEEQEEGRDGAQAVKTIEDQRRTVSGHMPLSVCE